MRDALVDRVEYAKGPVFVVQLRRLRHNSSNFFTAKGIYGYIQPGVAMVYVLYYEMKMHGPAHMASVLFYITPTNSSLPTQE